LALGALLLFSPLSASAVEPAPPASTEVVISEQARAHFQAGVQLLQDPDGARYEEAYEEFKAAYADSPSWKILGNLALCAMKLERDGEAIAALESSLTDGGAELDPADRTQQQTDLKLLKDRAAALTVRGSPGTTVLDERSTVSGSVIKNQYRIPESGELPLLLRPGNHRLTARFGEGSETKEATLNSGAAEMTVELRAEAPQAAPSAVAPPPAQEEAGPSKVPAYVSLGIGAAGLIVGGVFLAFHFDSAGQADKAFSNCAESGDCTQDDVSRIDQLDADAATQGTVSLISFGVGAVGIGTGVALLLLQPKKEAPPSAGFSIRPYASAHTFGLSGKF